MGEGFSTVRGPGMGMASTKFPRLCFSRDSGLQFELRALTFEVYEYQNDDKPAEALTLGVSSSRCVDLL